MIKESVKEMLEKEVMYCISQLSETDISDREKRSAIIEELKKVHDLKIEEEKIELEFAQKESDYLIRELESEYKKEQVNSQTKDRYFKTCIEIAGIVVPLCFYAVWMNRGFEFEKEGSFTSTTFKGLINRFRPTN